MNVFGFVLSEPTLWFAFAVCLLCIDLFIGTSMLLFMTLSAFIMMSVSMVFDDLNFATSAVVFSALCFITYFIVKAVVKSKRQDDINYANEDMMSFRFKLDQDVSAGVKTRIAINHIHYTVLARSNYNRTCQVMVYDVVDGVLLITSNIPSHEFAGEETIWGDIENPKLNTSDNVCDNARYNTSSSKNNPPPAVSDPTPSSNSSSASSIGDGNSCSGDSGC